MNNDWTSAVMRSPSENTLRMFSSSSIVRRRCRGNMALYVSSRCCTAMNGRSPHAVLASPERCQAGSQLRAGEQRLAVRRCRASIAARRSRPRGQPRHRQAARCSALKAEPPTPACSRAAPLRIPLTRARRSPAKCHDPCCTPADGACVSRGGRGHKRRGLAASA